ncbi:MAG: hypothetical protein ACAI38_05060 [Myxococcota bacterium]|nr:hypothetical protein [Myxococcota bacterium]
MDAVSGNQPSASLRLNFEEEANKAYAKLDSIGGGVKATAVAETDKVKSTFEMLNGLAKKSGFAETALKDGVTAFIRAQAAAAARAILQAHPNAQALGADALAKATTAIIIQGVIADLSRSAEAAKVFEGFPGANEAFVAGVKAAYSQPLETAYGEIEVTVPPLPPEAPSEPPPAPVPATQEAAEHAPASGEQHAATGEPAAPQGEGHVVAEAVKPAEKTDKQV